VIAASAVEHPSPTEVLSVVNGALLFRQLWQLGRAIAWGPPLWRSRGDVETVPDAVAG
jgi:hypothetical protein